MKTRMLLIALPALCLTSCFMGDRAHENDDANDAAGTGSDYLAREVTGTWMLSTDYRYDLRGNQMSPEFIRSTFKLGEVELQKIDRQNGFEFRSPKGLVAVQFGGNRPFPSIYHAEYVFDKLYQPNQASLTTGQSVAGIRKPAYTGPQPQGTGAELPAVTPPGPRRDTSAANDTASTISGTPARAAQFTEPVQSQAGFIAVKGVGDKAVWDPAKKTLHVLYNNHIVSVVAQVPGDQQALQEQARMIANFILHSFNDKVDEVTA